MLFRSAAVAMSVLVVGFVAMDGESNWMEGVMLVGGLPDAGDRLFLSARRAPVKHENRKVALVC